MADNLDFLAARLHGRRSRMAEAERLDALCRIRELPALVNAVSGGSSALSLAAFQRRLVQALADEIVGLGERLTGPGAALLAWLPAKFQVENLKILIRGIVTGADREALAPHLVGLPRAFKLETERLLAADSGVDLIRRLPAGPLRSGVLNHLRDWEREMRPFDLEAALDHAYLKESMSRTGALREEDAESVRQVVAQEADIFHLMLVVRGKFQLGLEAARLSAFHVAGTRIQRGLLARMLSDADAWTAAGRVVGRALDSLPAEPPRRRADASGSNAAVLETLAWNRYARVANHAFRRAHMSLGAVVGYVALRRVEVANLITLSEGIRAGVPEDALRARMLPRVRWGPVDV